jgi:uncharacterized membrane protein
MKKQFLRAIALNEPQFCSKNWAYIEPACAREFLFYIDYGSHKFYIVADEGINSVVPENFWEEMKNMLADHFKKSEFLIGLKKAIRLNGVKLKQYFPHSGDDDHNELQNELSKN